MPALVQHGEPVDEDDAEEHLADDPAAIHPPRAESPIATAVAASALPKTSAPRPLVGRRCENDAGAGALCVVMVTKPLYARYGRPAAVVVTDR